jgi:hypothetical protein
LPTKVTEGNEPETISGGLDRLAALSEGYDVRSNDKGTHVEMRFELTPVQFEEEPDDVDGDDSFDPRYARELVRALQGGAEELGDIAPALTLTIGRLLGGSRRGH